MQKLKTQKGITLIALIITIIVMLILVGVTISVSLNGGLFEEARNAGNETQAAAEMEILQFMAMTALNNEAIVDTKELKDLIEENGTFTEVGVRTYKSNKTGKTYEVYLNGTVRTKTEDNIPEGLLDYLLGVEDVETGLRPGRTLSDIVNLLDYSFKNVPEELGQLVTISINPVEYIAEVDAIIAVFDAYFVNITPEGVQTKYKVRAKINGANGAGTILPGNGVKEISYDTNTRVGKYVEYDNKDWIIIYDDNINGLQMISKEVILDENDVGFYLGNSDAIFSEESFNENLIPEIDGEEGKSDLERAMYSYDNAVTRLNNICSGLVVDAQYIKSVRSVGSNPQVSSYDNPVPFIGSVQTIPAYGTLTWFEDNLNLTKNIEEGRTYYTIGDTETEYKIKGTDMNCEKDFDRMVALGINATAGEFWLASRVMVVDSNNVDFSVRSVNGGKGVSNCLWEVGVGSAAAPGSTCRPVRPVISLEPTIQFEGEGTETSPFTIQQ